MSKPRFEIRILYEDQQWPLYLSELALRIREELERLQKKYKAEEVPCVIKMEHIAPNGKPVLIKEG